MTHDELLAKINNYSCCSGAHEIALRAVVELHKEKLDDVGRPVCSECFIGTLWRIYPCPTIQAIEKELV
jgi:hypothetical protein